MKRFGLLYITFPQQKQTFALPSDPSLLEAVFFIDAVPHPPCRGALVASVPLWVQQQVHILRSRRAFICQEQTGKATQHHHSPTAWHHKAATPQPEKWLVQVTSSVHCRGLTPVTAHDPKYVELGQTTQEMKEQLLPFFGFSKFTQVM